MARIWFRTRAAAERVIRDLQVTAYIKGGVGPVRLGVPAEQTAGEFVVEHPFARVDLHWLLAHADDPDVWVEEKGGERIEPGGKRWQAFQR